MSDKLKMRVTNKGAVRVNFAYIERSGSAVSAVGIDLGSKWASVLGASVNQAGSPTIAFEATKRTTNLAQCIHIETPTEICLPQFKGWTVWSVECSRYTARVCLIKNLKVD